MWCPGGNWPMFVYRATAESIKIPNLRNNFALNPLPNSQWGRDSGGRPRTPLPPVPQCAAQMKSCMTSVVSCIIVWKPNWKTKNQIHGARYSCTSFSLFHPHCFKVGKITLPQIFWGWGNEIVNSTCCVPQHPNLFLEAWFVCRQ